MNPYHWNPFRWIAYRWMKELGLPGMVGLAFVVLAAGGYLGIILPDQLKLERLTHEVAAEQERQKTARLKPAVGARSTAASLHTFYEFFPARQKAPRLLAAIYKAARDESINLKEGEYKYGLAKAGRLSTYQVNLPVKGSYVQIRKFIAKVLNSVPSAALNEVSFKREIVGSTDLDAKISFTIYLSAV